LLGLGRVESTDSFLLGIVKCRCLENGRLEEGPICIKLCFKLGKNGTETFRMLEVASGEETIGRTQFFERFSRCKSNPLDIHQIAKQIKM